MSKTGDKDKSSIIKENKQHETDTGSSEVQIAILSARINHLVEHLKKNKKDNHTRRGLLILVGRRQKLVKYLKKKNPESLQTLAKKLKLKIK
jgi:small subunit ribosomal protein S15